MMSPIALDRFRLRHVSDVPDRQIAWVVNAYREERQLEWCLCHLRGAYPESRVAVISDGDGCDYEVVCRRYACDYTAGRSLLRLNTCHLYVRRWLEHLLAGSETYFFKIDPDTAVWRRVSSLPGFSCVFGTLETMTEGLAAHIMPPANVQGGCIGLTRDAAAELVVGDVLNAKDCVEGYARTWARCDDVRRAARQGLCSDDFIVTWAASVLGLPIVACEDVCSRWRRPPPDEERRRYAITHPHKLASPDAGVPGCCTAAVEP